MKHRLRELLEQRQTGEVVELASGSKRVLGMLFALTFDVDPVVAWRSIEAMGLAAARIAEADPEHVRNQLRRLHWLLCEESGGIGWRAPEAMAEIVAACPGLFADYVPIVAHLIIETADEDLEHFRPGMLRAIGRLGLLATREEAVAPAVVGALDHADPQVRGLAVWTLARLGWRERLEARPELRQDGGVVELYEEGALRRTTVGEILESVLGGGPPRS